MKTLKNNFPLTAVAFIVCIGFFMGCEKYNFVRDGFIGFYKNDTVNNQLVGTWVSCGSSTYNDPVCGQWHTNPFFIDTISFCTNGYMKDNFEIGLDGYQYILTSDTTLFFKNDNWNNNFKIKFVNNTDLIIYDWRHRDFLNYVYHVRFKKITI